MAAYFRSSNINRPLIDRLFKHPLIPSLSANKRKSEVLCTQTPDPEQQNMDMLFPSTYSESTPGDRIIHRRNCAHSGTTSREDSPSNAECMVLGTREHLRDSEKSDVQKSTKWLQLQERLAIIKFWKGNQQIPIKEISKKFNVPRTTIYGIIKDKDILKSLTKSQTRRGLTLERYSMAESRFRILEELLIACCLDVGSRGFTITNGSGV
ncbi:hypothetical protein BGX34_007044 [Mortierella sp. NVP85]|nr:hypothetical protein BGX34_007044 [Mortierella sp. NVP85]